MASATGSGKGRQAGAATFRPPVGDPVGGIAPDSDRAPDNDLSPDSDMATESDAATPFRRRSPEEKAARPRDPDVWRDDTAAGDDGAPAPGRAGRRAAERRPGFVTRHVRLLLFSSLARRILVLNLAALAVLVGGILYLNQFREGLIDARIESLEAQAEILAGALERYAVDEQVALVRPAGQAFVNDSAGAAIAAAPPLDFRLEPMVVGQMLYDLVPEGTRVRVYDASGTPVHDSRIYEPFVLPSLGAPAAQAEDRPTFYEDLWRRFWLWVRGGDLPPYVDFGIYADGRNYPEVAAALEAGPRGGVYSVARVTESGEQIVTVAAPIRSAGFAVAGVLLLSTEGGEIDAIVAREQWAILRVFLVAASVTIVLSLLLAGTIAIPLRRLAAAADRVRRGVRLRRQPFPDLSSRVDEIGLLARSFRDMTDALHARMAAIESFAADVAHELKNPLTSLRSAVETLPLARNDTARGRLMEVIQHDVKRLDRLISDISDASRLDAELARGGAEPVDVGAMLAQLAALANDMGGEGAARVAFAVEHSAERGSQFVLGHESRLGQVIHNLVDNARSFSAPGGTVRIGLARDGEDVVITVDDDGPGIRPDVADRIFERFYTDRPEGAFGQHSGLGLSISRQIVEAHGGTVAAGNRVAADGTVAGARFTVRLPAGT